MKSLFDEASVTEVKERMGHLTPASERAWGTMSAPQAIAHCSLGIEMAAGDSKPPRMMVGRLLGRVIKPMVLKNDAPMRKNSPTIPSLIVTSDPNLEAEKARLQGLIDRFVAGGPQCCTSHPHAFFGSLTPEEWGALMYKHLDHHLRQFGV